MAKIKPLMPSLREKKRYVVFQVDCAKAVNAALATKTILGTFKDLFGTFGLADAGMLMLENKYNPKNQKGIVRIAHNHVDKLKASFTLIHTIEGHAAGIRCIGISGILKKAEEKFGG